MTPTRLTVTRAQLAQITPVWFCENCDDLFDTDQVGPEGFCPHCSEEDYLDEMDDEDGNGPYEVSVIGDKVAMVKIFGIWTDGGDFIEVVE